MLGVIYAAGMKIGGGGNDPASVFFVFVLSPFFTRKNVGEIQSEKA